MYPTWITKKAIYYYTNSITIDYDEKKKISFNILFCDLAIVATTYIIKLIIIYNVWLYNERYNQLLISYACNK